MLGGGFKIGTPGKKYGLIQPAAPKPNVPSIFSADDDEPKSMQQALKEEAIRKNKLQRVINERNKILEEDPTAFDYDGVYDAMKREEDKIKGEKQAIKQRKEPKYMAALLATAKQRQLEQDIIYERVQRKQIEKEKQQYGDTPKFVTSAYKKKLLEEQRWQEEEAQRLAKEVDVYKDDGMKSFLTHMIDSRTALSSKMLEKETKRSEESKPSKDVQRTEQKLSKDEQKPSKDEQKASKDEERSEQKVKSESKSEHHKELKEKSEHKEVKQQVGQESEKKRKAPEPTTEKEEKKEEKKEGAATSAVGVSEKKETEEEKKKREEEEMKRKFARKTDDKAAQDARARYLARKSQLEAKLKEAKEKERQANAFV